MMGVVDRHLRESKVPPHARPIQGWLEVSSSLRLGLRMSPNQNRDPVMGHYNGDDLTIRIFRWFDRQYGDKLSISFGPGRVFMLLRHDPWLIELPRIFGTVHLFTSATEPSSKPEVYLRNREIPRVNVVELVEGMTDGIKASLQPEELQAIYVHVVLGLQAMSSLEAIVHVSSMAHEAQSDIEAAVRHAMSQSPHYGQCKWSCLQAAEKILKIFLESRQKSFPKHHRLHELAALAEAAGLTAFDHRPLDAIQCLPGIRYGEEEPTTPYQALAAHVACLEIVRHVAGSV